MYTSLCYATLRRKIPTWLPYLKHSHPPTTTLSFWGVAPFPKPQQHYVGTLPHPTHHNSTMFRSFAPPYTPQPQHYFLRSRHTPYTKRTTFLKEQSHTMVGTRWVVQQKKIRQDASYGLTTRHFHISHVPQKRHGIHGAKHQLQHRVKEKVTVKLAERVVKKSLPRLIKRIGKNLGPRLILTKLGRGLAIAVPAVGGVFASIIAVVDYRRTKKEKRLGNVSASNAFYLAFICDIIDVLAHVFTALGLSGVLDTIVHHQEHLHEFIHISEIISVIAAIIATASAITGEFKSIRHPVEPEIEESTQAIDEKITTQSIEHGKQQIEATQTKEVEAQNIQTNKVQ